MPEGLGGFGGNLEGSVWVPPSKLFVPVLDETKFFSVEVEVPPKRLLLVVNFFLFINVLFVWLNPVWDLVLLLD